jgi:predicted amidohydrolase
MQSQAACMPTRLSSALAHINLTVGDFDGNARLILETRTAAAAGADLVVSPNSSTAAIR